MASYELTYIMKRQEEIRMKELELKYGCNPNQKPSKIYMADGSDLPIKVLMGRPGYINFLDAFNGWQLVRELKEATGLPAATSFKHVSPAGAAIGLPMSDVLKKIYWVDDMGDLSPLACAYARARGADRMSSFAGNDFYWFVLGSLKRLTETIYGVVIGQSESRKMIFHGMFYQLRWCQCSV